MVAARRVIAYRLLHKPMSRNRLFVLAAVLVALGVGAVLGYAFTDRERRPTFEDDVVIIPRVVGKPEREALAAIEAAGLKPDIYEHRHGRAHSGIGRVVAQQPPSARVTSKGNSIVILVARQ
jgi:beta-lactam-binding protein with PASTA domain